MTLIVGHRGVTPIVVPNGEHVLLIGPPASGKTAGFLVPSVLNHDGPVLVTSSKSDVVGLTNGRSRRGNRYSLTVGGTPVAGTIPVAWNPLAGCEWFEEAILRAEAMVQTVKVLQGSSAKDALWFTLASRTLAALMHVVALEEAGPLAMLQMLDWATTGDLAHPLELARQSGASAAHTILDGIASLEYRMRDSVLITLVQCLRIFDSPALQNTLSTAAPFDPRQFVASTDTLYVVAPLEHQEFFAALVVGLVDTVARAAMAQAPRYEHLPREGRPAVVLALDEVANIAPLHNLPRLVSAGSGQGVQVMAVLQDLSQAKARWQEQSSGFLTLFQHKVVLPGVMHAETLEAVSKCLPHLSAHGTPIPEYHPSGIASLRRHRPGAPGEALWIDGARPERVGIYTIHDHRAARGR